MLVQLRIRTAIDIVSGNDAVSRLENGQHRMDRRQTGGEGKSPSTMFELSLSFTGSPWTSCVLNLAITHPLGL